MFIKIINLFKRGGQTDYKGLDIEKIVAGTQVYDFGAAEAYFEYEDDSTIQHADLFYISEVDYEDAKKRIESTPRPPSVIEKLQMDLMSTQLALTNANQQLLISQNETTNVQIALVEVYEQLLSLSAGGEK